MTENETKSACNQYFAHALKECAGFRTFVEEQSGACGECFTWACKQAMIDKKIKVFHGIVRQPFSSDPPYAHAWIERPDGTIQDWQTMEAGHGGNWMGKGFPKELFYELYSPQQVKEYSAHEALENRNSYGHCGPWERA